MYVNHDSAVLKVFINMPVSTFFRCCCSDNPDFSFKANINFASDYPKKLFVVKNILNFFYPQFMANSKAYAGTVYNMEDQQVKSLLVNFLNK
jgi:hypothetical protein